MSSLSLEYQYLIIFSLVLLLPKMLLRFHIPAGITALTLGVICTNILGWFDNDQMILTLARLGITSLFVFAGMEIEVTDLKDNVRPLLKYLLQSIGIIFGTAYIVLNITGLSFQISLIIAIGIPES